MRPYVWRKSDPDGQGFVSVRKSPAVCRILLTVTGALDSNDFEVRYRVLGSRDHRFDGRFYVAVTSTGI